MIPCFCYPLSVHHKFVSVFCWLSTSCCCWRYQSAYSASIKFWRKELLRYTSQRTHRCHSSPQSVISFGFFSLVALLWSSSLALSVSVLCHWQQRVIRFLQLRLSTTCRMAAISLTWKWTPALVWRKVNFLAHGKTTTEHCWLVHRACDSRVPFFFSRLH